ncbi:MAG: fumarylacetoacetate hydrolase family protein [Planctomycetota bacterium]|jgi:2-keto-4-pentenoate hydratase/2-oxohepta-3-ene-1,7-dioic acid hydratase in catechol pathway
MRLATIRVEDTEQACVQVGEGFLPLAALNVRTGTDWPTGVLELIESGRLDELKAWFSKEGRAAAGKLSADLLTGDALRFAPLYRRPRKIWGIGLNYREHAADLDERAPTGEPASFMRPDTAIVGPGEEILVPRQSEKTTAEAELALVFGARCRDVPRRDWQDVLAGFTTVIDCTAEDILRRNPRNLTQAKSFDTFFSFGPVLVTPDEVGDASKLRVRTVVNDRVRAADVVANMTFPPDFLVAYHTAIWTALPGDVISTGTPGAAAITDGDVVECRIDGFPALRNPVRDIKKA